jgi:hypothetical protein
MISDVAKPLCVPRCTPLIVGVPAATPATTKEEVGVVVPIPTFCDVSIVTAVVVPLVCSCRLPLLSGAICNPLVVVARIILDIILSPILM